MARQGELFPNPKFAIALDSSRGEPRLWVRRLVIWEKPGEIIREVHLRRGLNIIWSPDPGAGLADLGRDAGSGHGAGKTLFCRLLRYCLGEDSFANDDLRKSIAGLIPSGLVGAEVVIHGQPWAVIRPIGQTRKHVAREGATLEVLADLKETGTGIGPLLTALGSRLFPAGIEDYLPGERQHASWLLALAWLSRDQECRFDHILDWRHRRADTGSVAIGLSKDQLLVVVRAFLGVIEKDELRLKGDRESLSEKRRSLERDLTYFQRRTEQIGTEFVRTHAVDSDTIAGGELALASFREAAESGLRKLEQQDTTNELVESLAPYRREREVGLREMAVIEKDTERLRATQTLHEEQLKALRGERANLDAAELKASLGPVCPVCSVPIDQALAEGCGLSHSSWDPTSVIDEKLQVAHQTAACNEAISRARRLTSEQQTRLESLRRRETELVETITVSKSRSKRPSGSDANSGSVLSGLSSRYLSSSLPRLTLWKRGSPWRTWPAGMPNLPIFKSNSGTAIATPFRGWGISSLMSAEAFSATKLRLPSLCLAKACRRTLRLAVWPWNRSRQSPSIWRHY